MNAAFHCRHEMQLAKALAGRTESPLSLTDAEFDEARDIASIAATDYHNQTAYYLVSRVRLHCWYRQYAEALAWAQRAAPLAPVIQGQVAEIDLTFFGALARLGRAAEGDVDAARADLARLAAWSALCPANFAHRHALLEAEMARVESRDEDAAQAYARAVASADAGGYVHDAALAAELAARHAAAAGRADAADRWLGEARRRYATWGAWAKVDDLGGED